MSGSKSNESKQSHSIDKYNNNNSDNDNNDTSLQHKVALLQQQLATMMEQIPIKSEPMSSPSSSTPYYSSTSPFPSYKNNLKVVILSDITKLATTITASTFKTFKDSFTLKCKLNCIEMYLQYTHDQVCTKLHTLHSHIPISTIEEHVHQQSSSLCAALQLALSTHWNSINDKMDAAIKLEPNVYTVDSIYSLWSIVLTAYETYSKFHKISWLRQLFSIKHVSTDDPAKLLERIQTINRLLIHSGTILPDTVIAAVLIDSIPSDMAAVQQQLVSTDTDSVETIYNALKLYYDSKQTKSGGNKAHSTEHVEKALAVKLAPGVCYHYATKGSCDRADTCNYKHIDSASDTTQHKSKYKSKSKNKDGSNNKHSSDDDVVISATFNDCVDTVDFSTFDEATIQYMTAAQSDGLQLERKNEFILDSGASRHICCAKQLLIDPERITPVPMIGVTNKVIFVSEAGKLKLGKKLQLTKTLYLQNASTNLVSVTKLIDANINIKWSKTEAVLTYKGSTLVTFKRLGGVYIYTLVSSKPNIDDKDDSNTPGAIINLIPPIIPRKRIAGVPSATTTARNTLSTARGTLTTTTGTPTVAGTPVTLAKCFMEVTNTDIQYGCASVTSDTLHARFGHHGQHDNCDICVQSKGRKTKIGSTTTRTPATDVYDRLHLDLIGPISSVQNGIRTHTPTLGGCNYGLTIVDEKSRYVHAPLLKAKSDAKFEIITLIKHISTQFNHQVKQLHSDRGTEFINTTMVQYCTDTGIVHTTSTAYKPQHNGIAERMNGVLCNTARAMLLQSHAPVTLWGEALSAATFIHNRTVLATLDGKSPYELVYNTLPNTNKLKVWGCDAQVHIQPIARGKFDSLTASGCMVGYCDVQNAYRILLKDGSVRISRDVHFNESSFTHMASYYTSVSTYTSIVYGVSDIDFTPTSTPSNHLTYDSSEIEFSNRDSTTSTTNSLPHSSSTLTTTQSDDSIVDLSEDVSTYEYTDNELQLEYDQPEELDLDIENSDSKSLQLDSDSIDINDNNTDAIITSLEAPVTRTRSSRISRPVQRYGIPDPKDYAPVDQSQIETLVMFDDLSMMGYTQAMKRTDANQWLTAMATEFNSLLVQEVGLEVDIATLPSGTRPITCRWLYKIKYDNNNQPIQHKARLVAHGHKQTYGVDYTDTYAPVAKSKSIKLILADAAINDKEIAQFDVNVAFLNATLSEIVYIKLPSGCGVHSGKVWKLNKALYGLRQSPHEWNSEIHSTLTLGLHYVSTSADPCIYTKCVNGKIITLFLYVDDSYVTFDKINSAVWLSDFAHVKSKYSVKELTGEWILNMKVTRNRSLRTISLSQQAYIQQVLSEHHLESDSTRTLDNPCDPSTSSTLDTTTLLDPHQHGIYRSIVGSLSYAANMTRIDIAYATSVLSRHLAAPTVRQLHAAKRVLRYLSGTSYLAMIFKEQSLNQPSYPIIAYTDASHANDLTDRKSTTGSIIKFMGNTICWQSKKQKVVALSSTEAEYYALSSTICESIWVKRWCEEVYGLLNPILVLCDNQSAIHLSSHDAIHQQSKHIDTRYHFIRDHIKSGNIVVKWISTIKQEADILTKVMVTKQFNELVSHTLSSGN
jgi:hypothetical protein